MNSKSLRRLASDHASLHNDGLPPNYLFPTTSTSDDLIQLDVLLAGPTSTPYALGLWKLHLEIPPTYPAAPPKAHFRTKIYHPNVDEATGAVCVETLKRDWDAKLTLRDVLVTVSCLLIQPNPASALNAEAGALLQEDYESFARRARLMTGIHAGVPKSLQGVVAEARNRGEEQPGEVETMVVRRRRRDDRGAGAVRRREVAKDDGERENQLALRLDEPNALLEDATPAGPTVSSEAFGIPILGASVLEAPRLPPHLAPDAMSLDDPEDPDFSTDESKENSLSAFLTLSATPSSRRPLGELEIPDEPDLENTSAAHATSKENVVAEGSHAAPIFSQLAPLMTSLPRPEISTSAISVRTPRRPLSPLKTPPPDPLHHLTAASGVHKSPKSKEDLKREKHVARLWRAANWD
ncbi:hypothetical protein B0A49_12286, partial [Cryomyces minteri]